MRVLNKTHVTIGIGGKNVEPGVYAEVPSGRCKIYFGSKKVRAWIGKTDLIFTIVEGHGVVTRANLYARARAKGQLTTFMEELRAL